MNLTDQAAENGINGPKLEAAFTRHGVKQGLPWEVRQALSDNPEGALEDIGSLGPHGCKLATELGRNL